MLLVEDLNTSLDFRKTGFRLLSFHRRLRNGHFRPASYLFDLQLDPLLRDG